MHMSTNVGAWIFIAGYQFEPGVRQKLTNIGTGAELLTVASVSPEVVGSDTYVPCSTQCITTTGQSEPLGSFNVRFEEVNPVDLSALANAIECHSSGRITVDGSIMGPDIV